MTAILASNQPHHDRAEQLQQLRRKMAAVSGKVGSPRRGHVGHVQEHAHADDLLPDSEARLPVPQLLADVLPNALPRGTVAVLSGARSLPLSMVAAVLMDGMDLIVLALGGRSVPLTRARAVVARAHHKGCTLLVTDGDWQGASIRLKARVCGYETTSDEPGFGRISKVRLAVCAAGRAIRQARTG